MLKELRIKNFAIIQELALSFNGGLVIFTGETGAGKSIILDALEAVLGGRAETAAIRTGDDRAEIEATFWVEPAVREPVQALLESEELLMEDPDYLLLSREIRQEGPNTARINGRVVTAALQREIGAYLVDIHGQSEHLSLLRVRNHLHLLDNYAAVDEILKDYRQVYHDLTLLRHELAALRQAEQDSARKIDLLNYQIQEIEAARLKPGEEETLRQDRTRLANAESLAQHSQKALSILESGTPEVPGISELLGEAVAALHSLSRIDTTAEPFFEGIESALAGLQDLALELQHYTEGIEFNPNMLDQIEQRIDLINDLKRKYGETIEGILVFADQARGELNTITNAEERLEELTGQESNLLAELSKLAQILSQRRHEAAEMLSNLVELELNDLNMVNARFSVSIKSAADENGLPMPDGQRVAFDSSGFDRAAFMVETNPGEGFKPLVKVASGGETSRLMLALKNVLAGSDRVPTLVFDEIDQGIGGRVGMVVGEKLWNLSQQHQVMCITHLPQLAAYGEQHFKVVKEQQDGRTTTEVHDLINDQRREELALMFGPVSQGTLQSADEIMQAVRQRTQLHR